MKTKNLILTAVFIATTVVFQNCTEDEPLNQSTNNIIPKNFMVDIPDAISHQTSQLKSSSSEDTLQGDEIYEHLANFIAIGEGAAQLVDTIMYAISLYNIDKPMSFTYEGEDDGRMKNLVVVEDSHFEGKTWNYQMTITDVESESNPDGGKALQVLWDADPIKGIAIIKPYNCNRSEVHEHPDAIYRIDYSEAGESGYDAHMIVSIAGLELEHPLVNPYSINSLKMFAGKKGDIIDVYGNSNHPNAILFSGTAGFNWAFVASGYHSLDIGVAEVGLPPCTLDDTNRNTLLDYYSIKNVFTREIYAVWPTADSSFVASYLKNTDPPGYFGQNGFISGGESPGVEYDEIEARLDNLSPYNPKDINDLTLSFK